MPDNTDEPLYRPDRQERQLTVRAVLTGCLIGSVVSCTNIYVGLKIGWSFGASIISAVLAFSLFNVLENLFGTDRLSVLETNIAQTSGSAAGYMSSAAGLLAAIPALAMLGYEFSWTLLLLWSLSVAFLGVFFAVPLRRQMIDVDKLKFPSGTATAETILAMFSDASEALMKSRVLLLAGLYAGLFTLANHFYPVLEAPPLHEWLPLPVLGLLATWTFTVYLGPSLLGAGFLIGPRVVLSLVAGGLLAWGVIGPLAQFQGWAPGPVMSYSDGPRGWILWPGVALMVSEALATLAFSWRTFLNALIMTSAAVADHGSEEETHDPQHIPDAWWMTGLFLGSLLTIGIALVAFGIPWYLTLVAILLSAVLAAVGVRSVGETDINPVGGMGKVTQLVFGGLAPGSITTNLLAAGITAGGASQAADMMQDLKTGKLLGASPRKQFLAQLCGICVGIVFAIPVYFLFTSAYELGSKELPAPAAMAWKAMAELLNQGFSALPPHSLPAIMIATLTGIVIAGLQQIKKLKPYVPSGLAMGIAFVIPAYYSLVMLYGLIIWMIWRAISPVQASKYTYSVASGLIAGEGLMGIVNAILSLLKIDASWLPWG
ncbi:MAG: OPT/YSL family transporter [Planctomycetaceae bacterium]|nr:OPT/YSL family transporter [Planctomycetaceae bacterium]